MMTGVERALVRLGAVTTPTGLSNDVIYVAPKDSNTDHHNPVLAFFGGDVQDYPEVMSQHRDHKHYLAWSLTSTALLLATHFPTHQVLVVKPARMERKTFSCYDNFVSSNSVGCPSHEPGTNAVSHLASLITQALILAQDKCGAGETPNTLHSSFANDIILEQSQKTCSQDTEVPGNSENINSDQVISRVDPEYDNLTLVGFSKGCVVLNQLITEMYMVDTIKVENMKVHDSFLNKISSMYWLDGGHAGGQNTWITAPSILNSLAARPIPIHIHVSPYQVRDELRPWIGQECKSFHNILRRAGAKVQYQLHFEDLEPSLFNHFKLLNDFME